MRIGLVTGEYPPMQGGVGAFTHILAKYLAQSGHDVFIFTSDKAMQQQESLPITTCHHWGLGTVRKLNAWAGDNQLDVINLQYQTAAYDMSPWIHFLPTLMGRPIVITFHDLRFPYLFPKAGPLRPWIVRHLARTAAGCILTNEEDFQELADIPHKTMIRIGTNIVDNPIIKPVRRRKKAGAVHEDFLIAFFGFMNHTKGMDTLLEAINQIKQTTPAIKLVILGGRTGASDPTNADYADTIDALIHALSLEENVTWTGYLPNEEVAAYLTAADIVALPFRDGASFRRGSLLAAIEQECAIVTTQPAVPVPAITDEAFCLVPPDDARELAHAIAYLRDHPEEIERLQNNVATISKSFEWPTITQQTSNFLTSIVRAAHV
ncbi:glycosyltransferase family 4 protein [Phototrophicus methaneseepsis]|uniref:Glycosyltransferase family 4 protein n=1 Tax=Phototrophicus methaneseepsis TaxID=2710758 RepID=A0A7S8ICU1_9CHLR|nr:glycosyltransferase family 4 protein [Phototrophicus methaneseepsis]QPC80877.1 glycosyltransferase family 4 protein [Phototrophicus methaneseepsis]